MSLKINYYQDLGDTGDWPEGTINSTAGEQVYEILVAAEKTLLGISSAGAPFQDPGGEKDELTTVIANCRTRLTALGFTESIKTD